MPENGSLVEKKDANTVTIQLVKHLEGQWDKCVVYHIHGGGFVVTKPKAYQNYLRFMAQSMPGLTIISPDYRLAPVMFFELIIRTAISKSQNFL